MKRIAFKKIDIRRLFQNKRLLVQTACILFILIAFVCISLFFKSNIQSEYTNARNKFGNEIYNNLYMLCQTYDQIEVSGQDLQTVIVPKLRTYYTSAKALNNGMRRAYGNKYTVMNESYTSQFDSVFEAFDTSLLTGTSNEAAQAALRTCVSTVRTLLTTRYDAAGNLKPE